MRTVTATLEAKQIAASRVPYFKAVFYDIDAAQVADYSSDVADRILRIEHNELPYTSTATIVLADYDRSVPDLRGCYVDLGYGDVTTGGNEYSTVQRMWVKTQTKSSSPGNVITTITLIGMMDRLEEFYAAFGDFEVEDANGYHNVDMYHLYDRDTTVYDIISEQIVAGGTTAQGFTLDGGTGLPAGADDGIIDTFMPYFEVNNEPYETRRSIIYRLILMTKCYLRPKASGDFETVYPQTTDTALLTFYSKRQVGFPQFYEYNERLKELVPNRIIVFGRDDDITEDNLPDGTWSNYAYGWANNEDAEERYGIVPQWVQAPMLQSDEDCDNRAEALMAKLEAEELSAGMVCPHDCRIELYDKLAIRDYRYG